MSEDYELCKKVCKEVGCYCPKDSGEFHHIIANTPAWVRFYHEAKGKKNERAKRN